MSKAESFGTIQDGYFGKDEETNNLVVGGFVGFENDEFVQVEQDSGGIVALWSSRLEPRKAMFPGHRILGRPNTSIGMSSAASQCPFTDIWNAPFSSLPRLNTSVEGISISCRIARLKAEGDTIPHPEYSIAFEGKVDEELVRELVASTATSQIIEAIVNSRSPLLIEDILTLGHQAVNTATV